MSGGDRAFSIAAVVAVVLLLSVGVVSATTYTVCASGCDYTTIQAAVTAASSYDTVYVWNGTYNENVDVSTAYLTLEGEGKDVVTVNATVSSDHVFNVTANYVNISGFTIENATGNSKAGIFLTGANYCNISYNDAIANWHGIYLYNSCGHNNITNNNASRSIQIGVLLHWVCSYNNITDNVANSNNFHGFRIKEYGDYNLIKNNTANNNINNGFYLFDSCNYNTIINNTMSFNAEGIRIAKSCHDLNISNNTLANNTKGFHLIASHNNSITCNWVHNSTGHGFYLTNVSPAVPSGADSVDNNISYNNIITNGNYNATSGGWVGQFNTSQASDVEAKHNYWGTTVSSEIAASIGNNTGNVTYEPFLTWYSPCAPGYLQESEPYIPDTPTSLANTTGGNWVNHTWSGSGGGNPKFLASTATSSWRGFNWTDSNWVSEPGIISGISDYGWRKMPTVFKESGVWYIIVGLYEYYGYNWTGSTWQVDNAIVSGLIPLSVPAPTVFEMGGIWYLISGTYDGTFHGYNWTGSTWQVDTAIVSGISNMGVWNTPTTFQKDGTWYFIFSTQDGLFHGYNWTGSTWQVDNVISGGLSTAIYSSPHVFQRDGGWYLIAGLGDGDWIGWHWNSSGIWEEQSWIVDGLTNTGGYPGLSVFDMGGGNFTDSYNVSVNQTWHNGTTNAHWNNTPLSSHGWSNITVYAWNNSGGGTLSPDNVSQNTQTLNSPITITNTSDWSGEMGANVYVDYDATDPDGDTPTFSCNRTDLFTDFSAATGKGNWTAAAGTYYVDFGVSDGYGNTSNYTMTLTVNATPPDPTTLANTTGNFWVDHTWAAGSGNVSDSYNVSVNQTWHNGTANAHWNNTGLSAHGWSNITVYAYNTSGNGTLSAGSISQDTQILNNPITITNVSNVDCFVDRNLFVDCDAVDVDSDTPTFSCNRTDLFTDFNTATGTGNWIPPITGFYYVDFGVSDGYGSTNNTTIRIRVTVAFTPPHDIQDGVFGFLNASIPDNDTIDRYKAHGIWTTESSIDWDSITSGTWNTYKNSVQHCYDVNRRSSLRISCDGDYNSSAYIATVTANITSYMPDMTVDPYQSTVQFIVINLSNTTSPDKADFVNAVAQHIFEQTDNKIKIVVIEPITGLDDMYVDESPVIYKALTTVSNWIDFEAVTLRGNNTKSRMYSGNESFMSDLSDHRTKIFNRMRNLHNISDQYTEAYSVKVIGGDLILYNSGAAKANKTIASAVAGVYWDAWNDTLYNNSGGGTGGFWLDAESYTYVGREDSFGKIVIRNNNSSILWASPMTEDAVRFYSNGSMTNSYMWGGIACDMKVEVWDPTYIKDNLFMIHYEWINASWVSDYTLYDYIIIADKNANEITNTINRPNNTYGYISVADYSNSQVWLDGKKAEVDDWADNYSTNIFLDGIDFVVSGTNFSARMKVLADYIMDTKDKTLLLNTYTAYADFATYGDAVMKESCFARWDGNVNTPTYSYEDMDIEKDRADYYTSHNIPVLGMSFGDVEDFDKMAYCAAAFAVLYGFDGDNCYRYGQPNFQGQRDINIYDFGNMLESAYTNTSATDWNRLYVAGRVHIDPVNHTWYIDDDKTPTNVSIDLGLYSGGAGSGDRNIYLYANGNTTQHTIPYYPGTDPVGVWTERSAYLDIDEHTDHGHYYIYFYTLRAGTGGWNFLGRHATSLFHPGRHSWYDTTLEDLPDTITGQTWLSLPRDDNWMLNVTVNYTSTKYVDELVDRITQGTSSSDTGGGVSHTTTILSDRDCAIPVWGLPVGSIVAHPGAITSVNNSTGAWVPIDVDLVNDADAGVILWNYTTVDGEEYGAVREFVSVGNYIYRYLIPHLSTHNLRTSSNAPTPPDPINLANTTGNFWINHTWAAGSGNATDSFNFSVNQTWHNGTAATHNNTTYFAHAWQNITVWAYNVSGNGTLSTGNVSQDTQVPNNPITITNTSDWSGEMGANVYVDYDATDPDSDTPTFSCNRTDLFTDFDTANGTGNWTAAAGTYHIDFGVSDGWGSTSNYTMTTNATAVPPDPICLPSSTGNFWVNHTWIAGFGNVSDSYNVSVNQTWHNATANAYWNNTPLSPHGWSNLTVYAWNDSVGGTLSSGNCSLDTQIPNNPITITNTSDWSGDEGETVYVDYDATDPDGDTPTFSCNRTDLFTDFSAATGQGNWTAAVGTYYVDFGVSDGYGSTSNYTMTITVGGHTVVTLLAQNPPTIYQNSTGTFNISWGISHSSAGLNDTSVSLIWTVYDVAVGCYNHSIRPPSNNKAAPLIVGGTNYGKIQRGDNRNGTLYFESNVTITGGNIYQWSGGDEQTVRLTLVPVNTTYSKVLLNSSFAAMLGNMYYLDRTDQQGAVMTEQKIYKNHPLLIKIWDLERMKTRSGHIVVGYADTHMAGSSTRGVSVYYLNSSYDPAGSVDPLDSPYAAYISAHTESTWVDYVHTIRNSTYIKAFEVNETALPVNTTPTGYLYFTSSEPSQHKAFCINITDSATITNRSFADTSTLWTGTSAPLTSELYTPNVFISWRNTERQFQTKLYAADTTDVWGNSTLHTSNIEVSSFDPTIPIVDHFNFDSTTDYVMNGTYSDTIVVAVGVATDPDGGSVTHNLSLWYANRTFVATINNTFTDADRTNLYAHISFNTTTYYSETEQYTLRVVATDDEACTSESWLGVNFTLGKPVYIPPDPITLANTTGNFWINHTWAAGSGNVSDSYNVSVNQTWHNTTTNAYWNNTPLPPHGWSNITVYAWNNSAGNLSSGSISQDTQIPNNPVTITNTSDWSGNEGANVYVDYDATDADSDTPTFSCNRTDLFTDFDTANGTGNWTAAAGTYYVDFGVSDGYGSIDNYTMTITVAMGQKIPPDPTTLANTTGTSWVNHTWQPGSGNVTDSYNVSVNQIWHNTTTNAYWNNTGLSAYGWSNITVYAYNASGSGTLSAGSISQNTQVASSTYAITLFLGWNLIGWSETTDRTARYVGELIGSNCTHVTARNRTTGDYVTHNMAGPASENNFTVERGWGYFVRVLSETVWNRS